MQCPQWGIGLWPILRSPDVASCQWMIRICLQSIDSSNFSKSVNKEAHIWPVLLEGCWQCFLNFYQRSHFGEKFSHLCILALLARSFAWKSMPVEANRWSSKETEQTHWSASWTGNYPAEKPHFLKLGRLPINISNRSLYSNSSKHVKTATLGPSKRESWSSSLEKIGSNCSFSVFGGVSSRPNDSNLGHDSWSTIYLSSKQAVREVVAAEHLAQQVPVYSLSRCQTDRKKSTSEASLPSNLLFATV